MSSPESSPPQSHSSSGVFFRILLTFALALGAICPAVGQQPPAARKHVLMLYGWGADYLPGNLRMTAEFERELARRYPGLVQRQSEYMDLPRYAGERYETRLAALYQEKYGGGQVDVVAAFGAPALRFALRERTKLWPGASIVFALVERRDVDALGPLDAATGAISTIDLRGTLDAALAVQPETRRVVVIAGTSPLDAYRMAAARSEFSTLEGRLELTYWSDLSIRELTARVGRLPPGTIILFLHMFRDASGEFFGPYESFKLVARASSVPAYGILDSYLDAGVVGGNLVSFGQGGRASGEMVGRLLAGEAIDNLPVLTLPTRRIYDHRALKRWHLDRRPLPPGAVLRNEEPSVWAQYRRELLATLMVCLLEAALIFKLLLERSGRRRAQQALDFRVHLLEFVLEMSDSAANPPPGQVDRWIEEWLRRLGEFLAVDDAALYECTDADGTLRLVHAWSTGSGAPARPSYSIEEFPWVLAALRRGEIVRTDHLTELPTEATVDRESCHRAGVRSFLAAPLSQPHQMTGVLSLTADRAEHAWAEELMVYLRLIADLFTAALALNRAETAKHASDQLNRALLDSLAVPTAILDHEGNILQVTGTWRAVQREDGTADPLPTEAGTNYLQLCLEAGSAGNGRAPQVVEGLRAVLKGTEREFRVRPKRSASGGEQSLELIVASLDLPGGGAIVTQVDLTERERAEREVQELRHTMTHVGRVAGLAELAGSLAHELNQPLTAILSNVQAARRFLESGTAASGEFREILADIEEDDKRAGEIIRRLRALIRKEAIDHHAVSLNDLAVQVAKLLAADLRLRHIRLELDFDPGLPEARADPMALQQVILNLMMNAEDAMQQTPAERRRLLIRTWQPDAQSVALAVRDYGTGIPEESLEQIFQAFYTTKKEGLGIGLAICGSILTGHGGRIWAVNNPDGGATVQFSLPHHPAARS